MKNLPLILISFFILFAPFYMEAQFNSSLLSKHQKVSYSHSNLESAYLKKPLNTSLFTFSSYQDNFPKSLHPLSGSWSPRPKYSVNNLMFSPKKNNNNMLSNRRLKYSSLWAFNSLNYLYADLVGVMDVNLLSQYQTGTVNGINITPGFLTAAAAYMQLPLSNVFLPHVIKNDKTLRWVQIVSGSISTLVQGATLFVGKPTPYYILFSVIEMGVTTYITIDAIKWKIGKKRR